LSALESLLDELEVEALEVELLDELLESLWAQAGRLKLIEIAVMANAAKATVGILSARPINLLFICNWSYVL
jgi:hypothetical protein